MNPGVFVAFASYMSIPSHVSGPVDHVPDHLRIGSLVRSATCGVPEHYQIQAELDDDY